MNRSIINNFTGIINQTKNASNQIINSSYFNLLVTLIICISAILIGAQTFNLPSFFEQILFFIDYAISIFFAFEIFARYMASESLKKFFSQGWNLFDTIIVSLSLIPISGFESILIIRLLRIFRILRLISAIPDLRYLVNSLIKSIPRMGHIALLMFIIFYIYAAIGVTFFKEINLFLWGDVSKAMLTLFRVSTFEGWTSVMYETQEIYPFSWIYYLSFIFLTAFVFINMMVGAIIDVMSTEQENLRKTKLDKTELLQEPATIEQINQLNQKIDLILEQINNKTK